MTASTRSSAKRRCLDNNFTPSGQKVDNSGCTLQKLFELYRQAELCDVQLQVGARLFHAHKLILSMSSDVFKTMLTDAKWPDARKACIVLNEEPECVQVFGEFLQYMYTGSIHLTNTTVLPVLTLADKYNIYDLGRECKHYMASHCHADLPNLKVVSWLQYAILCNDKLLESALRHYMELNFNHVMQSEDFLTMRQDILEEMLNCPHLVIHSEFTLFTCLKNWFLHNTGSSLTSEPDASRSAVQDTWNCSSSDEQRKTKEATERGTFLKMMSYVRLPVMKQAQLFTLFSDPLIQQHTDISPSLQPASSFHTCPHFKERKSVCGSVDDAATTSEGSRYLHKQRVTVNTHFSHSPLGSRTFFRRNSDSSIVQNNSKTDACSAMCSTVSTPSELQPSMPTAPWLKHGEEQLQQKDSLCRHLFDVPVASLMLNPVLGQSKRDTACCVPRNYTCDDWSTCLTIEEFVAFPQYGSQAYFFSTPASAVPSSASSADKCEGHEDTDDSTLLEWQAELYPRGVRFPRAKMIGIPDNYDIDESCRDVVRLAVNSKTHHHQPCRVDVIVLAVASGLADGSEYVERLTHKCCIFDEEHTVHNIDDIVPFWELNHVGSKYMTDSVLFPGKKGSCFKLVLIIKPAT